MTEKNKFRQVAEPFQNNEMTEGIVVSGVQRPDAGDIVSEGFTKDTLVSTSEGAVHLGGLHYSDKKPDVISRGGSVLKSEGMTARGVQNIFGLLTDSAYIKGTTSHRILRINPDCTTEIAELTDLRKGDFVVYQKGVFGSEVPEYHDEYLVASDAMELGRHISNMSTDNIQVPEQYSSDKFHNKSGYFSVNIFNTLNKFNNFVYRVPEKLLCAPAEFMAAYLRGYFDGGTRFHLNRITATAACRELASDIVYSLSLFGIRGKIMKTLTGFEVVIANTDDIERFIKEIGFLNKHDFSGSRPEPVHLGIDYKKLGNEYRLKASASSQDIIALPDTLTELTEYLDVYKESFRLLEMNDKLETLELLSHAGCRVTEVTEYAKYIGRDEVFTVTHVAENSTWCANGIVVSGNLCDI